MASASTSTSFSKKPALNTFASIKGMERGDQAMVRQEPRFAYFSIDHISLALGIRQKPLPASYYDLFDPSEILPGKVSDERGEDIETESEVVPVQVPVKLHGKDRGEERDGFQKKKLVKLYRSISEIFGESYTVFVNPKSNVSISYRFLDSIFTLVQGSIGPENADQYMMLPSHEKQNLFTEWIKKLLTELIDDESPTGGAYYAFNYSKNREMKRENIVLALNQALQNRCDVKIFPALIQYTVDMLGASLVILNMKPPHIDFEKSEIYHYKNIYNPLNPLLILVYDNGIYYPLIRGSNKQSILNIMDGVEGTEGHEGADAILVKIRQAGSTQHTINKIYKYMKMEEVAVFLKRVQEKASEPKTGSSEQTLPTTLLAPHGGAQSSRESTFFSESIQEEEESVKEESKPVSMKVPVVPISIPIPVTVPASVSVHSPVSVKKWKSPSKSDLEKMLKEKLEELCEHVDIPVQKKSEKTGKMISKTKSEMIADLLAH